MHVGRNGLTFACRHFEKFLTKKSFSLTKKGQIDLIHCIKFMLSVLTFVTSVDGS